METKKSNVKSNPLESTTLAEAIKAVEALKRIREWAESNKGYLSRSTDYARGYANGIFGGKNTAVNVREFQWKTFTWKI